MKRYLLAHDLGTTEGRLEKSATAAYDSHFFNNNWAEQNSEDCCQAVAESTGAIMGGVAAGEVAARILSKIDARDFYRIVGHRASAEPIPDPDPAAAYRQAKELPNDSYAALEPLFGRFGKRA